MGAEIDRLEVQVEASATKANNALDNLTIAINITCEIYFEMKIYLARYIFICFEQYGTLFGTKQCIIPNNTLILFRIMVII